MKPGRLLFLILPLLCLSRAPWVLAEKSAVLTPEGWLDEPSWTAEEIKAPAAKRDAAKATSFSAYFIRLSESEKPHTHQSHDLTVLILRGNAVLHLPSGAFETGEGTLQVIPRGTPHWVEIRGADPVLAYAVFSPPLEGKDYEPADAF